MPISESRGAEPSLVTFSQVVPFSESLSRYIFSTKTFQVSHARRVYGVNGEVPDSYVKCYLRDGDKWLHKRKTRVVRRTTEPHFKQTLKYQVPE